MSRYVKTITALLGALATWGITAGADSTYDQVELWGGLLALVTAAGVYQLPNTPPKGRRARADMSEQGESGLDLLFKVCAAVVAVVLVVYVVRALA